MQMEDSQIMAVLIVFLAVFAVCHGVESKHIDKRSDDPTPLEATVLQQSQRLDQLEAQLSAALTKLEAKDRHVAFMAQFGTSHPRTPASGPYKFDQVILNDGNAYDPALGIFTAPYSGVYAISAQFFSYGGVNERPLLDIRVNGNTQVRLAFDAVGSAQSHGEDSDSTTFNIKLNAGARVWVESAYSKEFTYWGYYHTFFSGALLYSEE